MNSTKSSIKSLEMKQSASGNTGAVHFGPRRPRGIVQVDLLFEM